MCYANPINWKVWVRRVFDHVSISEMILPQGCIYKLSSIDRFVMPTIWSLFPWAWNSFIWLHIFSKLLLVNEIKSIRPILAYRIQTAINQSANKMSLGWPPGAPCAPHPCRHAWFTIYYLLVKQTTIIPIIIYQAYKSSLLVAENIDLRNRIHVKPINSYHKKYLRSLQPKLMNRKLLLSLFLLNMVINLITSLPFQMSLNKIDIKRVTVLLLENNMITFKLHEKVNV